MAKTKAPKPPLQIPFGKDGSLITFSELKFPEVVKPEDIKGWHYYTPTQWKENYEFTDTLVFKHISTGRSAVNGIFKSETTGAEYSTFQSEFQWLIPRLVNGRIHGKFTFEKRGQNYGMCMVPDGPQ